jgi:hypothetical protein
MNKQYKQEVTVGTPVNKTLLSTGSKFVDEVFIKAGYSIGSLTCLKFKSWREILDYYPNSY